METKNLKKMNLQTEINLKLVFIAELKQMMKQYEGILANSQSNLWESGAYSLTKIDSNIQKRLEQLKHEEMLVEELEKELAALGPDDFAE